MIKPLTPFKPLTPLKPLTLFAAAFLLGIFVGANIATLWPGEAASNRCDEMK